MTIFNTYASDQQLQESLSVQEQNKYDELKQQVERLREVIEQLFTTEQSGSAGDELAALAHTGDVVFSFSYGEVPNGWLKCDGAEVSKAQYPNLYRVLGHRCGPSSQSDSFRLPKLVQLPYSVATDSGGAIWIIRT